MPKDIFKHAYLYLHGYHDDISIGKCFHNGILVDRNLDVAELYYREAAARKEPSAFLQLSILFRDYGRIGESLFYEARYYELSRAWDTAIDCYRRAFNEGFLPARPKVGELFIYKGLWYESLSQWNAASDAYLNAVAAGDAQGWYRRGKLFTADRFSNNTCVISKDRLQELQCYREGARAYSKNALDILLEKSKTDSIAAIHLAQMYETGELGSRPNWDSAIRYYDIASRLGGIEAIHHLGNLYETVNAQVKQNFLRAFDYYKMLIPAQAVGEALTALKRVADASGDDVLQLRLVEVYLETNNRQLALILLKTLGDKGSSAAIEKMLALSKANPEYAYLFAKLYERDAEKMYFYYSLAVRNNYAKAIQEISALADQDQTEALYILGYEHFGRMKKTDEAINYCLRAAEQGHQRAIAYLRDETFDAAYYLKIGLCYEKGLHVKQNVISALFFYDKAIPLSSGGTAAKLLALSKKNPAEFIKFQEATYYLIGLYTTGTEAVNQNFSKAFDYCVLLLATNDTQIWTTLKKLVEASEDDNLQLRLAETYHTYLRDKGKASITLKTLADMQNSPAMERMLTLSTADPEYAYLFAKLYENDTEKMYFYYGLAVRNNYAKAIQEVSALAERNQAEALYILGYERFHRTKNLDEAINYCLRAAEQGHQKAIAYLRNETFERSRYVQIGRRYERGDGVRKSISSALFFYEKAFACNDSKTNFHLALKLGQLHEINSFDTTKNDQKAFDYFMKAALQGNQDAIFALERLAEELGRAHQLKLVTFYSEKGSLQNALRASYWQKQSNEDDGRPLMPEVSRGASMAAPPPLRSSRTTATPWI